MKNYQDVGIKFLYSSTGELLVQDTNNLFKILAMVKKELQFMPKMKLAQAKI